MRSGQQGFFDRSPVIRCFLGIVTAAAFFLLFHFKEVPKDRVVLHAPANHTVVAIAPFSFPDEEQTMLARQEAMGQVGTIYRLRPDAFAQKGEEEARFADARTLAALEDVGLSDPQLLLLEKKLEDEGIPAPLFDEDQEPILQEDPETTAVWRRRVAREVSQVMTEVAPGSSLIEKGETVTAAHASRIEAHNAVLAAQRNLASPVVLGGSILLALLFVMSGGWYLRRYATHVYHSNRRLCLGISVLLWTLVLAKGMELIVHIGGGGLPVPLHALVLAPFAAILLSSLLGHRLALFLSVLCTLAMALTLSFGGVEFLLINTVAALVAVFTTHSLRRRKEVFIVCGWSWLATLCVLVALHAYKDHFVGWGLFAEAAVQWGSLLMSAVLVVGLLPLFESLFGIITDVTLVEFMDPTHPLLRKLSLEAPGTYQHSLVVGNLSESAAVAVGANGLFCRVAALYHDIGKVVSPEYFTENQTDTTVDPHLLLTPLESAQAVMAHVPEGVQIARRHGIPEVIIDAIKQHHGTTVVAYFCHQARESREEVCETDFRYIGPKPQSREAAILMIADMAEAASRSLDEINETTLHELVENLVRQKAEDGQFDDCGLTFREFSVVKQTVVRSLLVAGHCRIKYPAQQAVLWSSEGASPEGAPG